MTRHGLRTREAEALLAAWHATADTSTREALLRDPRCATPAPPAPSASPLGPTARALQGRFDQTERALDELVSLDLTPFAEPERRALDACRRRLAARVVQLAHTLPAKEAADADTHRTARAPATPARTHPAPSHRPPAGPGREGPSAARWAGRRRRARRQSWRPTTR